jgi:glutathione synthase/RimK-type ligase-like ATP-grasp enzyme
MSRVEPGIVAVTEAFRTPALDGIPCSTADEYLEGDADSLARIRVVVNLCRSYQYLSKGYYVSLLADARHQRVFPTLKMIEEMRTPFTYLRILREAGLDTVDPKSARERRRTPARVAVTVHGDDEGPSAAPPAGGDCVDIWCILGKTLDERFKKPCATIFRTYAFPILRVRMVQEDGGWKVGPIVPGSVQQLEPDEMGLLIRELSTPQFATPARNGGQPRPHRIACLWDADDPLAASDRRTLDKFARLAAKRGVLFERIGKGDQPRLAEYDALFIRSVTAIDHWSFGFAMTAESLGIPVIDDPQSIIKCSNKVYLRELFRRNGVAMPRTIAISRKTPLEEVEALGFPLIVKLPDGTFSQSVKKVHDRVEMETICQEMFRRSPLLIVQEFIPTPFDWRVGILEGRVLFVCKYHMAKDHWQIVSHLQNGERDFGKVEAVAIEASPADVRSLALESAALIGNGLYGVDVKETAAGPVVIEINDNPNIQAGYEDAVEKDRIYDTITTAFVSRILSRATRPA